jgi:WS/DGAT/MGAT family acyltransferase
VKHLSGLDATFLYLETPEMPMHVGALHLFELPAGYRGRFVRDLRRHVARRLPQAAVLRRKLWWMPLKLASPAWVDAQPDLDRHIVEVRLPAGSGLAELEAKVGALHPLLLDRDKPLWKFHVFEGLAPSAEGRKCVALYTQVHHAAVDGKAAVALASALFDTSPVAREAKKKAAKKSATLPLGFSAMLTGTLANQVQQFAQLMRGLPSTLGTLSSVALDAAARSRLLSRRSAGRLALAPRTPLNVTVARERAFATVSVPLAELKALGRAHDATLNDMVLMLCSTALRRYLSKRGALPRKSLIAAVPISLREPGAPNEATADNQVSITAVSLGTHIADPLKRLHHIMAAAAAMKETVGTVKNILPTDFPTLGLPWLLPVATKLYGRAKVAERIPQLVNVAISNVPGPSVPLYLAGARMIANYPTSIVVHGLALNITVQSYDRSLDFGLMADAKAVPDVKELAHAISIALDDIRALAGEAQAERAGVVGAARKVLTQAFETAVDAAGGLVPQPLTRAARAMNRELTRELGRQAVKTATAVATKVLPAVAQQVVRGAIGSTAGKRATHKSAARAARR